MAKRETVIAKEIAVAERLAKLESTPEPIRKKLESKISRLKKEARGIPMSAKQLANATLRQRATIKAMAKRDFNDLIRRLAKKSEYSFLKGMTKDEIVRDMARKAKPVGWRFRGRGDYRTPTKTDIRKKRGVYYEARPNRSDVSQAAQLKKGGKTWVQKSVAEMEKKGTVGLFTKKAKAAGMSTKDFMKKVLTNPDSYDLKTRKEAQWMANVTGDKYATGGSTQGYDARQDESLGMRTGRESSKTQSMKARREDSYGKWGKRGAENRGISMAHGGMTGDQAYYYADLIASDLSSKGLLSAKATDRKVRTTAETILLSTTAPQTVRSYFEDEPMYFKKGGRQGYDDRDDESLGMSHRSERTKQGYKARRDESKGERKYLGERPYRDDKRGK